MLVSLPSIYFQNLEWLWCWGHSLVRSALPCHSDVMNVFLLEMLFLAASQHYGELDRKCFLRFVCLSLHYHEALLTCSDLCQVGGRQNVNALIQVHLQFFELHFLSLIAKLPLRLLLSRHPWSFMLLLGMQKLLYKCIIF